VALRNSPDLPGRRRLDRNGEGAADTDHSGGYVIGADDTMPLPRLSPVRGNATA
jgi:hypothetical protein